MQSISSKCRRLPIAWMLLMVALTNTARAQSISGPELLALYGADADVFGKLVDGQPIVEDEREALLKVLYAARRLTLVEIGRWSRRTITAERLVDAPDDFRGRLCHLQGTLEELQVEKPDTTAAERFELPRYFRCRIRVASSDDVVTAYALAVPNAWLNNAPEKGTRVSFDGIFVKLVGSGASAEPALVAQRIAWHPPTPLGQLGMDLGLLDPVRDNTQTPITGAEREGFYQLLNCVERVVMPRLVQLAEQNVARLRASLQPKQPRPDAVDGAVEVALFNQPERHRGDLFLIEGTARRTTLIRVTDADIVGRMGIDDYYQMEVFTAGSQGNPLVICIRELPSGMPQGDNIYERVRVPAFFFKKWAYQVPSQNEDPAAKPEPRLQLAPLLIGRGVVWLPPQLGSQLSGVVTGLLILLMLLVAWWAVWRYTRGDRQFRRRKIAPLLEPEGGKSLNELGLEAGDKPDFGGLG